MATNLNGQTIKVAAFQIRHGFEVMEQASKLPSSIGNEGKAAVLRVGADLVIGGYVAIMNMIDASPCQYPDVDRMATKPSSMILHGDFHNKVAFINGALRDPYLADAREEYAASARMNLVKALEQIDEVMGG